MTEHHDPHRPEGDATPPGAERSGSLWAVLAPAAALLLGLVLGGVLVGVVVDDDDDPSTDPGSSSSPTAGGEEVSPTPGATLIVVPDECLAAADSLEQALRLVEEGAAAIRDFQPQQLRELLRELEELDAQARSQVEACQAVEAVDAESASPSPSE